MEDITTSHPHKATGHREFNSNRGQFITLVLDHNVPSNEKKMHCLGCGWVLCYYYGSLRLVIFGDHNEPMEAARPIALSCGKCKMIYRIA